MDNPYLNKMEKAAELIAIKGHPMETFARENAEIKKRVEVLEARYFAGEEATCATIDLSALADLHTYYAKKGDLIYPILKVNYEISGPSDLMWTDDDVIRDEMKDLDGQPLTDENRGRFERLIKAISNMSMKDENVIYPICAVNLTDEEWYTLYDDSKDYDTCFGVEPETWEEAEEYLAVKKAAFETGVRTEGGFFGEDARVCMPGGELTIREITALLNTIPMEITFVDIEDRNRFFNEGPKDFKRPSSSLGREVYSCHPPMVEPHVRKIIDGFKTGERDNVAIWSKKKGHPMLVNYMAVRDSDGNYVGTAELVQDMQFAKEHFEKEFNRNK